MYNSSQRVKLSSRHTTGYFKRVSRVSRDRLGPRRWLFRINRRAAQDWICRSLFGGGGIILETGWNHRPAGLNAGAGRYLGGAGATWNAEKPSVLLPMCAIPLPSLPFLIPLRVYVWKWCTPAWWARSILLPKRARLHRRVRPTPRTRGSDPHYVCPHLPRCYYPSPFERPYCEIINLAYLQKPPLRGIIWKVHYFTDDTYKGKFVDSGSSNMCAAGELLIFWRSIIHWPPGKKGTCKEDTV